MSWILFYMISLSVSVLSLFLELLSWPLADLDKTLSKSVKDRIIRSSSAVDLANGMSPSYSSYASPKRRSPQMAAASRMMPGATYSLRKNSVCSVFSSRCVMAVSHSKKRGVSSVNCMSWVGPFHLIYIRGLQWKEKFYSVMHAF